MSDIIEGDVRTGLVPEERLRLGCAFDLRSLPGTDARDEEVAELTELARNTMRSTLDLRGISESQGSERVTISGDRLHYVWRAHGSIEGEVRS